MGEKRPRNRWLRSVGGSEFLNGIDKKEFVEAMNFAKVIMVQGLTKQRRLLGEKPVYKWLPEPVCTRARPYYSLGPGFCGLLSPCRTAPWPSLCGLLDGI